MTRTHTIQLYLSEIFPSKFNLDKHYINLIDSPTGTGKTSLMFKLAKNESKTIIAFPYASQVIQQEKYYSNFQFLHNTKKFDLDGPENICCTYDKLSSLIYQDLDLNNYILHLDECHNLYTSAGYRNSVVFSIAQSIKNTMYKKVIMYSSTYEKKYLNHYIPIDNHQKFVFDKNRQENITCIHLENGNKVTMNDAIVSFFEQNDISGEKILIYRNNKSENEALSNVLTSKNYNNLLVDSDKKDAQEVLDFLKDEKLCSSTSILITTSMLTEGINILNENITQIHYLDRQKSSATIRQFASRPRKSKHEFLVWFKKNEVIDQTKKYREEWNDFHKNAGKVVESLNTYLELTPDHLINGHAEQLVKSNRIYHNNWLKHGIRTFNRKIILDHPRIASYFYELFSKHESNNSELLQKSLEKYGFNVHYLELNVDIASNIRKENKEELKKVREERRLERETILNTYCQKNFDVKARKSELLNLDLRTESESRELKMIGRWLTLEKNGLKNPSEIALVLSNGTDERAIYRNMITKNNHSDTFAKHLAKLITIGERYDAKERSDLILQAEKSAKRAGYNLLNIKKLRDGSIHGKVSKNIFMNLFETSSHVYKGKHTISILSH